MFYIVTTILLLLLSTCCRLVDATTDATTGNKES